MKFILLLIRDFLPIKCLRDKRKVRDFYSSLPFSLWGIFALYKRQRLIKKSSRIAWIYFFYFIYLPFSITLTVYRYFFGTDEVIIKTETVIVL